MAKKSKAQSGFRIVSQRYEVVPVTSIEPHPRNANEGDVGAIHESMEQHGFFGAVLVQESTRKILAGKHRWITAQQQGASDVPAMFVDCDDDTALRIMLADNRTARLGSDNESQLAELLAELSNSELGLAGTGFDADYLDQLIGDLAGGRNLNGDPDEIPERAPVRCKAGETWRLGEHRLTCSDSTGMDEPQGADTLFYDPPWDIKLNAPNQNYRSSLVFTDGRRMADAVAMFGTPAWYFAWDCITSWYTPNRPLQRMKGCLWYGDLNSYQFNGSHYGDAGDEKTVTNSRGSYKFKPDARGKHLSDVFSLSLPTFHAESEHKHAKPVDWVRMLLANCTEGVIYDPFAGSGTSIIAAEQLGRQCMAIEKEPAYCDVIIARWELMTGQKAKRARAA